MARHSGKGKPGSNTKAALNDTYKDVLTGDIYICKSIYNAPFGPKEYSWSLVEEPDEDKESEETITIPIPSMKPVEPIESVVIEIPEEEPEEELEMIDLNAPTEPTRQEKPRNNYRKQYNKHYNNKNKK